MEIEKNNKEKGSSLVEVLIAMAILLILMIGILQMYSAAFVVNQRSSLRTLEAYKCQQVAEIIRLNKRLNPPPPNDGIQLMNGFVLRLPSSPTDDNSEFWAYWGPGGANVIQEAGEPYRIYINVTQPIGSPFFDVRVAAISVKDFEKYNHPASLWAGDGLNIARRVEYVTRIQ